ncbi:MAG: hypothetical protein M3275_00360 [Thermoproteota archaeon]|nr:hypothetical protein [Thermoproteota archaeon]MDQ3966828.1 hypothetical protein [Thermoproteota archaeon]
MTQEDFDNVDDVMLSFVSLNDDNITMLLNGDAKYSIKLPVSISKKNADKKRAVIENKILSACSNYGINYVSEENVRNRTKEIVDQLYERARVTKNYVVPPSHPIIVEKYGNDYFEYLVDCVKKTVKEESSLVRKINYVVLSGYGNDPINLGVLAPTSTGKSHPITESIKFTPQGKEVRKIGSMTPKVLIRERGVLIDKEGNPIGKDVRRLKRAIAEAKTKKKFNAVEEYQDELEALLDGSAYLLDMTNVTLIFLEPPRPELWDLIKPILSHDSYEMEHPFVDKIGNSGMEVKRVITRGWPACIFCSAKDESRWDVWPEIESRFMIDSPNIVKAKFQAGNKLIAHKKGLPRAAKQQLIISDTEQELAKQCFLYLKHQIQQFTSTTDSPVWIPYLSILADIFPSDRGQDNRAFNRFATMLNIIALSKAHLRYKLIYGDEELVIATLQDLMETLHVMHNMTGLPPHKLKFYQQYIVPLFESKHRVPLKTSDIADFYNANAPAGAPKLNSDNIRKTYLEELVRHNYLEQDLDEETKAKKYVYTPLVDMVAEEKEEQENEKKKEEQPNPSNLGQFFHYLHFAKLILPQNHPGIASDWLKQEILQLSKLLLTSAPLRILDIKGNDVPIEDFIRSYESDQGLKLQDFVKVPRRFGHSKGVKTTTSEHSKTSEAEKTTTNDDEKEEKWQNRHKFGQFDGPFDEVIKAAIKGKGYDIND